jgi:primosomal protein N' (replication factor Y)
VDRSGDPIVEVAVTLPVPGRYTYRVPPALAHRARVGARVLVRFGPRKVTGVIVREGGTPPPDVKVVDV